MAAHGTRFFAQFSVGLHTTLEILSTPTFLKAPKYVSIKQYLKHMTSKITQKILVNYAMWHSLKSEIREKNVVPRFSESS